MWFFGPVIRYRHNDNERNINFEKIDRSSLFKFFGNVVSYNRMQWKIF